MTDDQLAGIIVEAVNRETGAAGLHKSDRSTEHKRAVVSALLERFPDRATRWLSRHAGVSDHLVERIVAESGRVRPEVKLRDGRTLKRSAPRASRPTVSHDYQSALAGPVRPITPATDARRSLPERYRPMRLADVVGQSHAVASLQAFAADPFPAAFILYGPTGTGKTASGLALANDLGCDPGDSLSGFRQITSGKQDGAAVDDMLQAMRHRPMSGSGWRVSLVNEADGMTRQAESRWLDGLESLPDKSVCVFTTNDLRKLSDRFIGRCEVVEYHGDTSEFHEAMAGRCRSIWHAETGRDDFRPMAGLGVVRPGARAVSLRAALKQIEGQLRCLAVAV